MAKATIAFRGESMNLKIYPDSHAAGIAASIRARFGIPESLRLLLLDEDECDAVLDSSLRAGSYTLSTRPDPKYIGDDVSQDGSDEPNDQTDDQQCEEPDPERELTPAEKRARTFERILDEIVETEAKYLNRLQVMDLLYAQPFLEREETKRMKAVKMVSPAEAKMVFGGLEGIINVSRELLDKLGGALDKSNGKKSQINVGAVFVQMAPYLRTISPYVANFQNAHNFVTNMLTSHKPGAKNKYAAFRMYHSECMLNPASDGQSLEAMMIEPVQRIPRYTLLLQSLLDNIDETHPGYMDTKEALELSAAIASGINEATKRKQQREAVVKIQELTGLDLVEGNRAFYREGELLMHVRREAGSLVHVYIFNDLIVVGSWNKAGTTFTKTHQFDTWSPKFTFKAYDPVSTHYKRLFVDKSAKQKKTSFGFLKQRMEWSRTWSSQIIKKVKVLKVMIDKKEPMVDPKSLAESWCIALVDKETGKLKDIDDFDGGEGEWALRYIALTDTSIIKVSPDREALPVGALDLVKDIHITVECGDTYLPHTITVLLPATDGTDRQSRFVLAFGPTGESVKEDWLASINMLSVQKGIAIECERPVEEVEEHDGVHYVWEMGLGRNNKVVVETKSRGELDKWLVDIKKAKNPPPPPPPGGGPSIPPPSRPPGPPPPKKIEEREREGTVTGQPAMLTGRSRGASNYGSMFDKIKRRGSALFK